MSYYDDPLTFIHAQIASQTSILTDYNYTLNKVNTNIDNSYPVVPSELIEQQTQLQINIINQQEYISTLQSYLVIDLSSNEVVPPLVDLSGSEVIPPLVPQTIPQHIDLSGNTSS